MVFAYQSSAIIIVINFWNVIITNTQTWMQPFVLKIHELSLIKLESKMSGHADRVTGEGFVP
jgi:hypothetical protein